MDTTSDTAPAAATAAPDPSPTPRRAAVRLLATRAVSDAGGRFHGLSLALVAWKFGGLAAVSGLAASGLVGATLAAAAATSLSRRVSGRALLQVAAAALLCSRLSAWAVVAGQAPVLWLLATQLVGSTAGTLTASALKAQTSPSRRASAIAWLNVSGGAGMLAGTAAASIASAAAPTWLLVSSGVVATLISTVPLLAMARHADPQPATDSPWPAMRRAVVPVAVGAVTFAATAGFVLLRDGIVAELFGARWLTVVTGVAVAGSWVAAPVVMRITRTAAVPLRRWPLIGVVAAAPWALADRHLLLLLAAVAVSAAAAALLAALVEARVLSDAGSSHGVAALTASGAVASLLSAVVVPATPRLLDSVGFAGASASAALLLTLAAASVAGAGRRRERDRSARRRHPAGWRPLGAATR